MLAASTTAFAGIIAGVLMIGWLAYAIANVRAGRREIGSEIELAANRKPYYDDETLEGPKLERTQLLAVLFLVVSVVALPLYWIMEPQRMENSATGYNKRFAKWGAKLFDVTANGGFNCAGCHGGMKGGGGGAAYTVQDSRTGEVKAVTWAAPALNTVLYRFSESELRFILEYGRPFSPMSPWGLKGGGPMNDQQIQTLIEYIKSIQIKPEGCAEGADAFSTSRRSDPIEDSKKDPAICDDGMIPADISAEVEKSARDAMDAAKAKGVELSYGEALFNNSYASGAFSCARCHTTGWSYGQPRATGTGAFGPNLRNGATVDRFPDAEDMIAFLKAGSTKGKKYGSQGQGNGKMPGFGHLLTEEQIRAIVEYLRSN